MIVMDERARKTIHALLYVEKLQNSSHTLSPIELIA